MDEYIDISRAFGSSLVEKAGSSTALNSFVPIKKVAEVKNITTRAVRLSIQSGQYIAREINVQGGKSYEILFESLEYDIQALVKENPEPFYYPAIPVKSFVPDTAKTIALARIDLIKQWGIFRIKHRTFFEKKVGKKTFHTGLYADEKQTDVPLYKRDKLFLEMYNSGEFLKRIFNILGKTSNGTLKRWKLTYDEFGTWESLVPQYKYSSMSNHKTILTDEMIDIFLKFLLHPNKFSIGKSISLTIQILKNNRTEDIPSIITFRRYAERFRKHNFDKWTLMRDGEKALKDKVEPYIERDISQLEVGDVLIADGHKLNFQVINPFTGKPTRATLVGFLDWKSTALVGYEIMLEENTQCIASALRRAILTLGLIPKIVYQDNGRAFRAKYFQSCNFEEAGFSGVYENLGIKSVFAKPYNARAKVIERFFLEFQEEFEKLMPSYTGTSIQTKPAWLMRNEKLHKELHSKNDFIPTIEQTKKLLESWIDYHNSKPCPNAPQMTIKQVLNSIRKQNIDKNRLDDLMLKTDLKTIQRNGIRFLHTNYYNEALYGLKEKVFIRYSLFDLTQVKVYSIKGEFICTAKRITGTHPMAYHLGTVKDMEDFKQKIQMQKRLKNKTLKAVKNYLPIDELRFLEVQLDEELIEPTPTNIIELKPKKQTPREEQTSKRLFSSDYEKYEWLMQHGCTKTEDRHWLANYIRSDEYNNLYADCELKANVVEFSANTKFAHEDLLNASNQEGD